MGNVIFIFVRWSHHFASLYTNQFLPNTTAFATTAFPVLHLLPMDSGVSGSFNDYVINYQDQILDPTVPFSEQVSFVGQEFGWRCVLLAGCFSLE